MGADVRKRILAILASALVFDAPVAFACDGGTCNVVADGGCTTC
jgi:hypothetical protein